MMEAYIREYMGIINKLNKTGEFINDHDCMLISREKFEEFLYRNKFESLEDKKKVWKSLKWIRCDIDNKITRSYYDKNTKKSTRVVWIESNMYSNLERLMSKNMVIEK